MCVCVHRLFGLSALIQTNVSDPYVLTLHEDGSWPAMVNPLLLLILYFTLIALLHRWTSAEVPHIFSSLQM